MADGLGVMRTIVPRAALEVDPRVRGLLDAPTDGALPATIRPREPGSPAIRIASVNIHMATPARLPLDPANESVAALRDVARFINAIDADVVFVQELRDRPTAAALVRGGVGDMPSMLAHLIRADEMAFTPAIANDPATSPLRHYGTGIFTRNGFHIDQVINARLPTSTPDVELRSVGVASIVPPDERAAFTAMSSHLANRDVADQPLRNAQLGAIVALDRDIRAGRPVAYLDALEGRALVADGFDPSAAAVVGDLNQVQAPTDAILVPAGLQHVNDVLAATGQAGRERAEAARDWTSLNGMNRIDHAYVRGLSVVDSAVADIPRQEVAAGLHPTDHRAVVVDLARDPA